MGQSLPYGPAAASPVGDEQSALELAIAVRASVERAHLIISSFESPDTPNAIERRAEPTGMFGNLLDARDELERLCARLEGVSVRIGRF